MSAQEYEHSAAERKTAIARTALETIANAESPCGRLGQTARRQRGRHRHARPPATPRSHPEMRAKELAYENGLAGPGENGLKESRPGPHTLAGFDLTTIGRF